MATRPAPMAQGRDWFLGRPNRTAAEDGTFCYTFFVGTGEKP